jgi:hypothetical protein
MATANTPGAIERLTELDQAIVDAEKRRDAIRAEQRAANLAVARAKSQLLAAEERRGAGEDVVEDVAAAEDALAKASEVADFKTEAGGAALIREGGDGPARLANLPEKQTPVLGVWAARLAGAERVIEDAILTRDQFGRNHFAELAAEEVEADEPARAALVEAWETLQAAGNQYARRVRRWHHLAPYGDIDPEQIPTAPLGGTMIEVAQRFEAGLEVPTPRVLR